MSRLMMVDTENVLSANFLDRLLHMKNKRWEIVFVLGPTKPCKALEKLYDELHVKIVRNPVMGQNSCDFVLVADMMNRILHKKYDSICIISKDKGFDSAVNYVKNMGYHINRYDLFQFYDNFEFTDNLKTTATVQVSSIVTKIKKGNPTIKEIIQNKAIQQPTDNANFDKLEKETINKMNLIIKHYKVHKIPSLTKKTYLRRIRTICETFNKNNNETQIIEEANKIAKILSDAGIFVYNNCPGIKKGKQKVSLNKNVKYSWMN